MSRKTCSLISLLMLAACASAPTADDYSLLYAAVHEKGADRGGTIYQPGSYDALASDQRARRVGDVVFVQLIERTQATKAASAKTSRSANIRTRLPTAKPFSYVPDGLLDGGGDQSFDGKGTAAQSNQLTGDISAVVEKILPSGTLYIRGRKQIVLNRGTEFIEITGLIRPQDIQPGNRIDSPRIADVRMSYTGRGEVAIQSKSGWLQRFFTLVTPF
jgi:flagellar L-ring protein precursor FlgH